MGRGLPVKWDSDSYMVGVLEQDAWMPRAGCAQTECMCCHFVGVDGCVLCYVKRIV